VETSEKRRGRFAGLLSTGAGTEVARDLREIKRERGGNGARFIKGRAKFRSDEIPTRTRGESTVERREAEKAARDAAV